MNGVTPLLDLDACRTRQMRLRQRMAAAAIDAVVVVTPEHVQYLTGHRWDFRFVAAAAVLATGETLLVCPDKPVERAAADEVRSFEAKWRSTLRMDQRQALAGVLGDWLRPRRLRRVGIEFAACPPLVTAACGDVETIDIEPVLFGMRRHKDPDELVLLRRAIAATPGHPSGTVG